MALVGTGPGDPELLTLRAARALRSADVILFDDAIAPDILDFSRREAKKMLVRTTGDNRSAQRREIGSLAVTFARSGKRVVRLMTGDPASSREAQWEIAAYQSADITLELIPGVAGAGKGAPLRAESAKATRTARARARHARMHQRRRPEPSASS